MFAQSRANSLKVCYARQVSKLPASALLSVCETCALLTRAFHPVAASLSWPQKCHIDEILRVLRGARPGCSKARSGCGTGRKGTPEFWVPKPLQVCLDPVMQGIPRGGGGLGERNEMLILLRYVPQANRTPPLVIATQKYGINTVPTPPVA